jgi:hypothetical protein
VLVAAVSLQGEEFFDEVGDGDHRRPEIKGVAVLDADVGPPAGAVE